jgi:hypothetical protein
MASDMSVPLDVVLQLRHVRALTSDPALVLEAIQRSSQVRRGPRLGVGGAAHDAWLTGCTVQLILDERQRLVKPSFKVQRNTIILRDIAADVPEEVRSP